MTDPSLAPFRAVAFSGSLRVGSSNTGLLHLARRLAADLPPARDGRGLVVQLVDGLDRLPFYNPDLEAGLPDVAVDWRRQVSDADAVVIGLPEYNFGAPGLAKNAIDWLTRPLGPHALRGKVIALMTSGGKGGGSRVQVSIAEILGLLGNTIVADPVVTVAHGANRIAGDGATEDAEVIDLVRQKMANVLAALSARDELTDDL